MSFSNQAVFAHIKKAVTRWENQFAASKSGRSDSLQKRLKIISEGFNKMTDDTIKAFGEKMMETMQSLNPTVVFLASSKAQLHMAKVVGLPQSALTEEQQKLVVERIEEIQNQVSHLIEFLNQEDISSILDKEILSD
jgi:peptide deformylase